MAVTMTRPAVVDDDGSGNTGTIIDAAWVGDLCDGVDDALAELDETGTFTPGVSFGGGTSGITYNGTQGASYKKDGDWVTVTGVMALTNKGASTGTARLTGLPFAIAAGNAALGAACFYHDSMATIDAVVIGLFTTGGTTVTLATGGAATATVLTQANFQNTTALYFTFTYRAT